MLAHLPDELRNSVPISLASGIVKMLEVAPTLGRVRSRLLMDKTDQSVPRQGQEESG